MNNVKFINNVIKRNSLAIAALVSIAIIVIILLNAFVHERLVRANSRFVYTIVQLGNPYHVGNVRGKYIEYYLDDVLYRNHCRGKNCINAKPGDRFLIKVYLDDPEIFEVLFSKRVKASFSPPKNGFHKIPSNCCE